MNISYFFQFLDFFYFPIFNFPFAIPHSPFLVLVTSICARQVNFYTLQKYCLSRTATLYFSQFKTPKQVKADFGQNQIAHETHSLKQFFLKKQ